MGTSWKHLGHYDTFFQDIDKLSFFECGNFFFQALYAGFLFFFVCILLENSPHPLVGPGGRGAQKDGHAPTQALLDKYKGRTEHQAKWPAQRKLKPCLYTH